MSKSIKKAIVISVIIIITIIAIISTFFIVKNFGKESEIKSVKKNYLYNNIQDITVAEGTTKDDLVLKIDGENIVGTILIEKINFEGLIYEGTADDTLDKGVCHMENSPYLNGNVCLAAHNTKELWGNLHMLQTGDKITYTSFLGTKEYIVNNIVEIDETDWTLLQDTEENKITLITCIKDKPFSRLCVQASEKI